MNERVTIQPQKKAATPAQSLSPKRTSPHQHGCACSKCASGGTLKRSAASAHTMPPRPGHDFGRVRIQAKLAVGALDDEYEREADRVTDQVMSRLQAPGRGHEDAEKLRIGPSGTAAITPLSRSSFDGAELRVSRSLQERIDGSRGKGQALPLPAQRMLAPILERDLSNVRVHTDPAAHQMTRELQAHAFTLGRDVYFGPGRYAPDTESGRRLLVHELTHAVQQGASDAPLVQTRRAQAATPTKKKITRVTFYPDIDPAKGGYVDLQLEDGSIRSLEVTYNGQPNPGTYEIRRQGQQLWPTEPERMGGWARNGKVVAWTMPEDATFKGVDSYVFEVKTAGAWKAAKPKKRGKETPAEGGAGKAGPGKGEGPKPKKQTKKPQVGGGTGEAATKTPPQTEQKQASGAPTPDAETRAKLEALPKNIRDLLLGDSGSFRPEDYEQLLRIAEKLQQLSPQDLELYKLVATHLTKDLNAFEQSIDVFFAVKEQFRAQAEAHKVQKSELQQELEKTWEGFDAAKFASLSAGEKEALALEMRRKQTAVQLEYMGTHLGETAVGMAEGLFRPDQVVQAMAEDLQEAADGSKSGFARAAGLVGALGKDVGYVAGVVGGVAGVLYVASLFIPGINVATLAATAITLGVSAIFLTALESDLRIQAAKEAKEPEEFKLQVEKSAVAMTNVAVQAVMVALHLAIKLIARIPLRGRFANVGEAFKAARASLLEKTGVGPAVESIRASLLEKLKGARAGLPEALAEQVKQLDATAEQIRAMTGQELLEKIAAGDSMLEDATGITQEMAKTFGELAKTPEGQQAAETLRQNALKALQDAPAQAGKTLDDFLTEVDSAIDAVEKANSAEQIKAAIDSAEKSFSPEEVAKKTAASEQGFLQERLEAELKRGEPVATPEETPPPSAEKVQSSAEKPPAPVENVPAPSKEAPVVLEEAPVATEKTPPVAEEAPLASEKMPSVEQKAPVAEEQVPPATEEKAPSTPTTPEEVRPVDPKAAEVAKLEKHWAEIDSQLEELKKLQKAKEAEHRAASDEQISAKKKRTLEERQQAEKKAKKTLRKINKELDDLRGKQYGLQDQRKQIEKQIASTRGPNIKSGKIKPGSSGGKTAGEDFSPEVKKQAFVEDPTKTCVYCGREGMATDVDHAIPKSKGGNATIDNAQLTCEWCNTSKLNRSFPVNPPPGYTGNWPPPWWPK